jgi:hypothetical protein
VMCSDRRWATGEGMGIGGSSGWHTLIARSRQLRRSPLGGCVYLSFPADQADHGQAVAQGSTGLGFTIAAPPETARRLDAAPDDLHRESWTGSRSLCQPTRS